MSKKTTYKAFHPVPLYDDCIHANKDLEVEDKNEPKCEECGTILEIQESYRPTKTILLVVCLGAIVLSVVGYFFYNVTTSKKEYQELKSLFYDAIKADQLVEAEALLDRMKAIDGLEECQDCPEALRSLKDRVFARNLLEELKKKYVTALQEENSQQIRTIFGQLMDDSVFKGCSACQEELEALRQEISDRIDFEDLKAQFYLAVENKDVSTAEDILKKIEDEFGECVECRNAIKNLKIAIAMQEKYDSIKQQFSKAIKNGDLDGAKKFLAQLEALDDRKCPPCRQQIAELIKASMEPEFAKVSSSPEGGYEIPPYLRIYTNAYTDGKYKIEVKTPFYIQRNEVTIADFNAFVSEQSKPEEYGDKWKKDSPNLEADSRPVEYISYEKALEYAKWLSSKTGSAYSLPSTEQWVAACVKFGEDPIIIDTKDDKPISEIRFEKADHLIGNVREWSSSGCERTNYKGEKVSGVQIVGVNYRSRKTDLPSILEGYCTPKDERFIGVGFRLVKKSEAH